MYITLYYKFELKLQSNMRFFLIEIILLWIYAFYCAEKIENNFNYYFNANIFI